MTITLFQEFLTKSGCELPNHLLEVTIELEFKQAEQNRQQPVNNKVEQKQENESNDPNLHESNKILEKRKLVVKIVMTVIHRRSG